jgi:hypothetical protein
MGCIGKRDTEFSTNDYIRLIFFANIGVARESTWVKRCPISGEWLPFLLVTYLPFWYGDTLLVSENFA